MNHQTKWLSSTCGLFGKSVKRKNIVCPGDGSSPSINSTSSANSSASSISNPATLSSGEKSNEHPLCRCEYPGYRLLDCKLGEGNTASVYLARQTFDGKLVAVKKFKSFGPGTELHQRNIVAEYYVARGLRHQNIVRTYELLSVGCNMMVSMEFVPHNLFDKVQARSLSPHDVESCFMQIVIGAAYIHSLGFAHRDLKLENILLTDKGQVKIVDFGAVTAGRSIRTSQVGSEPYMPPELFTASHYNPQIADVWSVAIIYVCMILHRFPWMVAHRSDVRFMTFFNLEAQNESPTSQNWLSGEIPIRRQSVLKSMLQFSPSKRSSLDQVSRLLATQDPLFYGSGRK